MMFLVVLLAIVATARAGCDNMCSGHGTCGLNGVCTCYDNWGLGMSHDSGDCSERICPFEFSWVDTPDEIGAHHKYTECASKGICNRETAQCECFAGYEGKACQRTTCPNDCSGHGQCEYIENLGFKNSPWDYETAAARDANDEIISSASFYDKGRGTTFDYHYWDKTKTRGCVCDPEWADSDCSKRMCAHGNDVMDHRLDRHNIQTYHTQQITFYTEKSVTIGDYTDTTKNTDNVAYIKDRTFALSFKSKLNETFTTIPIVFRGWRDIGNNEYDQYNEFTTSIENALEGLPNQIIDEVKVSMTPPQIVTTDFEVIKLNISFTGDFVQGNQNLLHVHVHTCGDGCTPKLDGLSLKWDTHVVKEIDAHANTWLDPVGYSSAAVNTQLDGAQDTTTETADFNSYECGRRGKCDYDSGICECFEGYTGIACNTITALV